MLLQTLLLDQRRVADGQRVQAGTPIMVVVPLQDMYVDANFKEVQLSRVRPGQPVLLKSDLYGSDVFYHGRVAGFAGGTGSAFAAIPAQNATGNWIKVVQRLPVRVRLDPKELNRHPEILDDVKTPRPAPKPAPTPSLSTAEVNRAFNDFQAFLLEALQDFRNEILKKLR